MFQPKATLKAPAAFSVPQAAFDLGEAWEMCGGLLLIRRNSSQYQVMIVFKD